MPRNGEHFLLTLKPFCFDPNTFFDPKTFFLTLSPAFLTLRTTCFFEPAYHLPPCVCSVTCFFKGTDTLLSCPEKTYSPLLHLQHPNNPRQHINTHYCFCTIIISIVLLPHFVSRTLPISPRSRSSTSFLFFRLALVLVLIAPFFLSFCFFFHLVLIFHLGLLQLTRVFSLCPFYFTLLLFVLRPALSFALDCVFSSSHTCFVSLRFLPHLPCFLHLCLVFLPLPSFSHPTLLFFPFFSCFDHFNLTLLLSPHSFSFTLLCSSARCFSFIFLVVLLIHITFPWNLLLYLYSSTLLVAFISPCFLHVTHVFVFALFSSPYSAFVFFASPLFFHFTFPLTSPCSFHILLFYHFVLVLFALICSFYSTLPLFFNPVLFPSIFTSFFCFTLHSSSTSLFLIPLAFILFKLFSIVRPLVLALSPCFLCFIPPVFFPSFVFLTLLLFFHLALLLPPYHLFFHVPLFSSPYSFSSPHFCPSLHFILLSPHHPAPFLSTCPFFRLALVSFILPCFLHLTLFYPLNLFVHLTLLFFFHLANFPSIFTLFFGCTLLSFSTSHFFIHFARDLSPCMRSPHPFSFTSLFCFHLILSPYSCSSTSIFSFTLLLLFFHSPCSLLALPHHLFVSNCSCSSTLLFSISPRFSSPHVRSSLCFSLACPSCFLAFLFTLFFVLLGFLVHPSHDRILCIVFYYFSFPRFFFTSLRSLPFSFVFLFSLRSSPCPFSFTLLLFFILLLFLVNRTLLFPSPYSLFLPHSFCSPFPCPHVVLLSSSPSCLLSPSFLLSPSCSLSSSCISSSPYRLSLLLLV